MIKYSLCIAIIMLSIKGIAQEYANLSTVEEQLEDYQIFKTTLLKCHSGIYDYNDTASLSSSLNQLESKLASRSMTLIEQLAFYSKTVVTLKCIHTGAYHKKLTSKTLEASYKLPFAVYFSNDQLWAAEDYAEDSLSVRKYDQILSINNELVKSIRDSLYQYIPSDGHNLSRKKQVLKHRFLYYYFLYKRNESHLSLQYLHEGDTMRQSFELSYSKASTKLKESKRISSSIDSLRDYALLKLPFPLPSTKRYKKELRDFMENISEHKIENLIIDLRDNGGGKSQQYLAGFFINSNIEYERMHYASIHNATYKKHFIHKLGSQYLASSFIGHFSSQEEIYRYVEPQIQYSGNLFILINGNTGSAASNVASVLKEWGNAIIIGQESGGAYRSYNTGGAILQLPNSKIRIPMRSIKGYNNVTHSYDLDGVSPDFSIQESMKLESKEDLQLNYIIEQLIPSEAL